MSKFLWTDAILEDLKARWTAGETATQIARTYARLYDRPFTRNMIISQFHRRFPKRPKEQVLAMLRSATTLAHKGRHSAEPSKSKTAGPNNLMAKTPSRPQALPGPPPVHRGFGSRAVPAIAKDKIAADREVSLAMIHTAAREGSVSLMALEAGQCRFVTGAVKGEWMYCGRPVDTRKDSYCRWCRPRMVNRNQALPQRDLARSLRRFL